MYSQSIIHIAYAEDHTVVRKGIASIINGFDNIHIDIEAENGKALIGKITKNTSPPDICILDINMPVMNGFDTITELRKRWPELKILILTAFDLELYIIRMVLNRANGFLLKSCDPDEIKKAILAIYNSGVYFSDVVTQKYYNAIINKMIKLPELTPREMQVLINSCSDLSYTQIAQKLKTTRRSVEGFRDSLFKKLNTNSRIGLVLFAIRSGLVPLEINSS